MKLKLLNCGILLAVAISILGSFVVPARAENTLKKMGKAIQYTTRKDAENLSIDTHRALGHKSVEKDRKHNARWVVKPNGHKIYKGPLTRHHHHHATAR